MLSGMTVRSGFSSEENLKVEITAPDHLNKICVISVFSCDPTEKTNKLRGKPGQDMKRLFKTVEMYKQP